jgi:hypothetical protein
MSNKTIAINWAQKQVRAASGFVYSDEFFRPFTNPDTQRRIIQELDQRNVTVWPDTKQGAFLFRKNDSRLTVETDGTIRVGVWIQDQDTDEPKVLMLPAVVV